MPEAAVTLNGRVYHLACSEGEEARLTQLSRIVSEKLEKVVSEFGQVGDDRLLLLAALLIADDMLEAREKAASLEKQLEAAEARSRGTNR